MTGGSNFEIDLPHATWRGFSANARCFAALLIGLYALSYLILLGLGQE
jgi:hypothetical protein